MTTIELLKPHTHAGVLHPAGALLTVSDRQAAWLVELGAAQAVAPIPEPVSEPVLTPALEPEPEPAPEPEDPEMDDAPVGAGFSPRPNRVRRALKDAPTP